MFLLTTKSSKYLIGIFLFTIGVNFLLTGFHNNNFNIDITARDQSTYLNLGYNIKIGKGFVSSSKIKGQKNPEGNCHPLYPYLLSFFASSRSFIYFERAKIFNLYLSLIILIILFFFAKKIFGCFIAIVGIFLLSFNAAFQSEAIFVSCEILHLFFTFLTCFYVIRGFEDEKKWIWAGIYCGLTYLTKGSGLLLFLGFIFSCILIYKKQIIKKKFFYFFLICFFIVVSPLIIRNLIEFKSLFYNVNTKYVMWADSWDEFKILQREGKELPTMFTYVKTHSLKEVFLREIKGIGIMINVFITAVRLVFIDPISIKKVSISIFMLRYLVNLFLFILFILGVSTYNNKNNKKEKIFMIVLFSLYFFSFAWYTKIVIAVRFIFPLIPFLYFYGLEYFKKIFIRKNLEQFKNINLITFILILFTFGYILLKNVDFRIYR